MDKKLKCVIAASRFYLLGRFAEREYYTMDASLRLTAQISAANED